MPPLMYLDIGVVSNCKSMGFEDKDNEGSADIPESQHEGKTATDHEESGDERGTSLSRHMSESSVAATEDDDDDVEKKIDLGPQFTLKEQLEKDKVHFLFFSSSVILKDSCFFHLFVSFICVCCFLFDSLG